MALTYGQSPDENLIPTLIGFNTGGHLMDFAVTRAQTLGIPKLVLGSVAPMTGGLSYSDRGKAFAWINARPVAGQAVLRDGDVLTYRSGPEEDSPLILKLALTLRDKRKLSWSKLPLGASLPFISANETLTNLRISNFRENYAQYHFRRTAEGYTFKANDNTLMTSVNGVFLPGEVALAPSSLIRAGDIWYYYTGKLLWVGSALPIALRSGKSPADEEPPAPEPVITDIPDLGVRSMPVMPDYTKSSDTSSALSRMYDAMKAESAGSPIKGSAKGPVAKPVPAPEPLPAAPADAEPAKAAAAEPLKTPASSASTTYPEAGEPVIKPAADIPASSKQETPVSKPVSADIPAPSRAETPVSMPVSADIPTSSRTETPVIKPVPAQPAAPQAVKKPAAAPVPAASKARPDPLIPPKPEVNTSSAFHSARLDIDIRARRVRKGLKMRTLLEDIRLTVEPGDFVLILGGSGAGKSTFIKSVMGYDRADGKIRYGDLDVYRDYEKVKYEIGYVPQQNLVRMNDTVYHTLMSEARMKMPGDTPSEIYDRQCDWAMALLGLEAEKNNMCSSISGGQLKRLSIAIELVGDPGLFFLDEPDSGLDGTMSRKLMENLKTIADLNKIVMVITHGPDRAADLFSKVLVLGKTSDNVGHLLFYGGVSEAKSFFETDSLEHIVRRINSREEGGEGLADHFLEKYRALTGTPAE